MKTTNDFVKENERVDDLQNGYSIIQDPEKFCFGIDAVLLSGFAKVKKGENVLDMGTGTGIIPVLLSAKTEGEFFTGLEIQSECAEMEMCIRDRINGKDLRKIMNKLSGGFFVIEDANQLDQETAEQLNQIMDCLLYTSIACYSCFHQE